MNASNSFLVRCRFPQWLALCALGFAMIGVAPQARADSCTQVATAAFTLPTSLLVPRDVAVGTLLGPGWIYSTESRWNCTAGTSGTQSIGDGNKISSTLVPVSPAQYVSNGGYSYPVYQTSVSGIGVILGFSDDTGISGWVFDGPLTSSWTNYYGTALSSSPRVKFQLAFVKTVVGAVLPGVIAPLTVADTRVQTSINGSPIYYYFPGPAGVSTSTGAGPTVLPATCETQDVDVPLGTNRTNLFTGINSKVAVTDFTINVNNCPAGMTSVRYRLELAPGVPAFNATNGVVKLDATSTATGVGVQVMNRSNVAYNFSTMPWNTLTPTYAPATGGNYTIPLRAAYYQTAATVTPGTANSAVMFTMEYK